MHSYQHMKTRLLPYVFLLVVMTISLQVTSVRADYISYSGAENAENIAEIYVLEDRVRLNLEVFVRHLDVFQPLVPEEMYADPSEVAPLEERQALFANKFFRVVDEDGTELPARFMLAEPRLRIDRRSPFTGTINPITRRPIPGPPDDKRVLYAEVEYLFEGRRPKTLNFVPPLDDNGVAQVSIGFIAYHQTVPIIDFRFLGKTAKLELDWQDPWYSRFDNPNLKRHNRSAIASFLYVESFEVRHEMLVRVRDMSEFVDLGIEDLTRIPAAAAATVKNKISSFLVEHNTVSIDGITRPPIVDKVDFVVAAQRGIQIAEPDEDIDLNTAIVGIIFAYIVDGLPQQVDVDWDVFPQAVDRIPAIATDPAGPLQTFLTRDDNVHSWTNLLKTYQDPVFAPLDESEVRTKISVPVVTVLLGLAGLAIIVLAVRARAARALYRACAVGAAVVAFVIAFGAQSFTKVDVAVPALLAPRPGSEQAEQMIATLLRNTYRAFDFREEEAVYDKLATSVSGELLTDIYLQNRKSFEIRQAGGAQARIKDVEIVSVEPVSTRAGADLSVRSVWAARGEVDHWGHRHQRRNIYEAIVDLGVVDGAWKIIGFETLEERRIEPFGPVARAADVAN
jgi:hypothetical protein